MISVGLKWQSTLKAYVPQAPTYLPGKDFVKPRTPCPWAECGDFSIGVVFGVLFPQDLGYEVIGKRRMDAEPPAAPPPGRV